MAKYVEFDVEKLLGPLNILQKANFGYAAKQSLKIIGFQVAKKYLPDEMERRFDSAVPYTKRSVRYGVEGQTLTLSINKEDQKGNAPAKYLFGVMSETGGKAYPTRFAKWLWDKDLAPRNKFPMPAFNSPAVPKKKGGGYGPPNWFYSQTQAALARELTRTGTTTVIGTGRKSVPLRGRIAGSRVFNIRKKGDSHNKDLSAGIYRVKSEKQINQLFIYRDNIPLVPPKLPFHKTATEKVKKMLPSILSLQIQKSIAKTR
tara:strand:+ start:148 stop:924 length:777 start_codon:yes stop_codon:yes gene_type:complete